MITNVTEIREVELKISGLVKNTLLIARCITLTKRNLTHFKERFFLGDHYGKYQVKKVFLIADSFEKHHANHDVFCSYSLLQQAIGLVFSQVTNQPTPPELAKFHQAPRTSLLLLVQPVQSLESAV